MYSIILVDDDGMISEGLSKLIVWEEYGIKDLYTAKGGAEALEILAANRVDLLITDIRMPGMDGIELLGIVSRRYPEIQRFVLSGYSEFDYIKRALPYGIINYLLKPVQEDELSDAILRATANIEARNPKPAGKALPGSDEYSPVIAKILSDIGAHCERDINIKNLSKQYHINPAYLGQLFRNETGELLTAYLNQARIEKAKLLLLNDGMKASLVSEMVGYTTPNYFYRIFKKITGVSPSEYKQSGDVSTG